MRKVNITLGFCGLVCFMGWLDAKFCLWFLVGIAVHEAGHLLSMVVFGVPVKRFHLTAAGAVIDGGFIGYGQELFCAAAGPASSFLLAVICGRSAPELSVVSGLLGAVNLLPIYPLDGGRILRSVLLLRLQQSRAEKILRYVTAVVSSVLMVCACWAAVELQSGLWPVFAALVVLWRGGQAARQEQ